LNKVRCGAAGFVLEFEPRAFALGFFSFCGVYKIMYVCQKIPHLLVAVLSDVCRSGKIPINAGKNVENKRVSVKKYLAI